MNENTNGGDGCGSSSVVVVASNTEKGREKRGMRLKKGRRKERE